VTASFSEHDPHWMMHVCDLDERPARSVGLTSNPRVSQYRCNPLYICGFDHPKLAEAHQLSDTTCIPQPRFGSWRFPTVGGER